MVGSLPGLGGAALLGFTAVVAVYDTWRREIPNEMNLLGGALGVTLNLLRCLPAVADAPLSGVACNMLLGALVAAGVAIALWRIGALGGGDVKLLVACGVFVGPLFTLRLMACSLFVFAALAMWRFQREGRLGAALRESCSPFTAQGRGVGSEEASALVPFGPAVFLGVCFTLLLS